MAHNQDGVLKTPIITVPLKKLKLAADHVLMQISMPEAESKGGIIIPEKSKRQCTMATVLSHGKMSAESIKDKGLGTPKIGSQVILSDHMVETPDFEHDGIMYRIICWDDLTSIWLP